MILPIYLYGSSYLRKKNEPVDSNYPQLKQLIEDMFDTMYNAEGVGLAAPQIGKSLRLFVVDANPMAEDYCNARGFKKAFVNPEILETSGESHAYKEGCLSIPDFKEEIMRKDIVKIKYFDENFNEFTETFDGIISRIIQHEYDHIEQIMIPDLLSQLKKKLVKRKLDNIKSGKTMPSYKALIE